MYEDTSIERFWRYVDKESTDCWLWTGSIKDNGYPQFAAGWKGSNKCRAHRWAYEYFVGPIPSGMQLDHLCNVRRCVRPDHLEPVTNAENSRRAHERIRALRRGH